MSLFTDNPIHLLGQVDRDSKGYPTKLYAKCGAQGPPSDERHDGLRFAAMITWVTCPACLPAPTEEPDADPG